jgi:hypothetical protein
VPYKDLGKRNECARESMAKRRAEKPDRVKAIKRKSFLKRKQENPAQFRSYWLKRMYGIDICQWNQLFEKQGRKCAICGTTNPNTKKGWHTDHDHRTGKVRGILCIRCNIAVGIAESEIMSKIQAYLVS